MSVLYEYIDLREIKIKGMFNNDYILTRSIRLIIAENKVQDVAETRV